MRDKIKLLKKQVVNKSYQLTWSVRWIVWCRDQYIKSIYLMGLIAFINQILLSGILWKEESTWSIPHFSYVGLRHLANLTGARSCRITYNALLLVYTKSSSSCVCDGVIFCFLVISKPFKRSDESSVICSGDLFSYLEEETICATRLQNASGNGSISAKSFLPVFHCLSCYFWFYPISARQFHACEADWSKGCSMNRHTLIAPMPY